ncbi:hypothetical protein ACX6B3_09795, partial [Lactobacillus delbrueckii subsp. lactis]
TAFTGVDSQNLPDVMVSVQFILAIGEKKSSPSALTFPEQTWKPAIFTKRSKTPSLATGSAAIKFILRLRKVPSMTAARPWSKPSSTSMTWGYQVWMDDFGSGYFP